MNTSEIATEIKSTEERLAALRAKVASTPPSRLTRWFRWETVNGSWKDNMWCPVPKSGLPTTWEECYWAGEFCITVRLFAENPNSRS